MSDAHGATVHHVPAIESSGLKQPYHLVDPSPWPIVGAVGGLCTVLGIIFAAHYGSYILLVIGVLIILFTMAMWWRDVIRESRTPGLHTPFVRLGLRYGMMLFITSEVMFFVGFFWAYFNFLIFPETQGNGMTVWPPSTIHTFDPFHIPFLNTMILLLSGCTVTWAHHSLLENDRKGLLTGLGLTIILGMCFTLGQAVRHLSVHLLPRHRLPRLPRHRRHVLPDRVLVPRQGRPVHARAAFRLRGGCVVLAFRRCGLAVPVHLHLLVRRQPRRRVALGGAWPSPAFRSCMRR